MDERPDCGMLELAVAVTCLTIVVGLILFGLFKG